MLKMAPSSCVVLYTDGQFKCQMNHSETVSQIRKIYMPSSAFCQRFWILINLYVILALTRWVQEDNKTSSTIPPVTFKLMMVSSNYCLCGLMKVLIRQLQQLLTTVAQLLPGLYHCDYHLRTTAVEDLKM